MGGAEFDLGEFEKVSAAHSVLVQRIPLVEDRHAAWLLLSFCVAARANFVMRTVSTQGHDTRLTECLGTLIRSDNPHAQVRSIDGQS